jgi:hypothetical protein
MHTRTQDVGCYEVLPKRRVTAAKFVDIVQSQDPQRGKKGVVRGVVYSVVGGGKWVVWCIVWWVVGIGQ